MPPKYSLQEIERRWLVDPSLVDMSSLGTPTTITDRYLTGTRLRLRKMQDGSEVTYKFVKKYGREGWSEPITNLYLTQTEYDVLSTITAIEMTKKRYRLAQGSLDVIQTPSGEIAIFEIEFESLEQAEAFVPPTYATEELLGESEHITKLTS